MIALEDTDSSRSPPPELDDVVRLEDATAARGLGALAQLVVATRI